MRYLLLRKQGLRKQFSNLCFMLIVSLFLIGGCAGSGKPPYAVENYLINYPPPSWDRPVKLDTSLKLNRFSIAAAYNSVNMVFMDDPYRFDSFNYSKWAVNPADMIADSLLRDLRESGFFQAVFSRYETDEGQFVISGSVEEFFLRMEKGDKKAVVGIAVSLKDTLQNEADKGIIFQKKYYREEPLQEASPRGYSQAASQAVRIISEQITSDVSAAIKAKLPSAKD